MTENILHQNIVKLLNAYARHDICWWHCPNGEKRDARTAGRLKKLGVISGAPDLMFVVDRRFHGLELKTYKGIVSRAQHGFKITLERAGGFYHVAFGLEQAIGVMMGIKVFRTGISFATSNALDGRGGAQEGDGSGDQAIPSPVHKSFSKRSRGVGALPT